MTEICFVVEAPFVVKVARERAWMDRERGHARRILKCIDGLPNEAITKILDGDATLTGDSRVGVLLVEEPDEAWKKVVADRRKWFASTRRKLWLREQRQGIPTDSVGRWQVPKHLIDQYVLVIARIKGGAFLGVSAAFANDPLAFFALEERRVALHDEIMACLGLDRESEDGQEFSIELHEKYGLMGKGGGA